MANTKNEKFASSFMIGVAGLASSISQAGVIKAQGVYAETVANINSRFAEMEARDILKRGDNAAAKHGKKIGQLVGAQRVAAAAQGIVVGAGSAGDIEEETRAIGYEEQETIRNNAWRSAFGLRQEASFSRQAGSVARMESDFAAQNTIIGGGLGFIKDTASAFRDGFDSKGKVEVDASKGYQTTATFDPAKYGRIS